MLGEYIDGLMQHLEDPAPAEERRKAKDTDFPKPKKEFDPKPDESKVVNDPFHAHYWSEL